MRNEVAILESKVRSLSADVSELERELEKEREARARLESQVRVLTERLDAIILEVGRSLLF